MPARIESLLRALALVAALAPASARDARATPPCAPPAPAAARAATPTAHPPAATAPSDAAPASRGFAGTIVDLSCDVVRLAGGAARCDDGEHHFALRMEGERGLRAIEVAQSTPVGDALHSGELTGREVCVTGDASPSGVLRVTGIHPLG